MIFSRKNVCVPGTNGLAVGEDPHSFVDLALAYRAKTDILQCTSAS